ncbi:MAG: FumA C-terminus/TtdB family hydratase beta subunit [Alicyclobacillus macrosporangiidus]|nr:FumA C-terminus/TtdB family hydratase beta subunit [Alicyclobacillus macrosporangiidus]
MPCPPTRAELRQLRAGDRVYLTGTVLTARDHAHGRLAECARAGEPWPVDVTGQVIYYVGPSPGFGSRAVGAAGPTTSSRMDRFTPLLLDMGVVATIGKGYRSQEVKDAMRRHGAVYFVATGGAGALLGACVERREVLAYPDLGPEAITRLWIRDFPVLVAFDTEGHDLYEENQRRWRSQMQSGEEGSGESHQTGIGP